jgi:hypothetical protein
MYLHALWLTIYKHISVSDEIEKRYMTNSVNELKDEFQRGNLTTKISILKFNNKTKE